jgi:hypothetical protein
MRDERQPGARREIGGSDHRDRPGHARVELAEIVELAQAIEGQAKGIAGGQRAGSGADGEGDGVRAGALMRPGDRIALKRRATLGIEEVITDADADFGGLRWRETPGDSQ